VAQRGRRGDGGRGRDVGGYDWRQSTRAGNFSGRLIGVCVS